MKSIIPWLAFVFGLAYIASGLRPPPAHTQFNLQRFGQIPVLLNGRIKPLDTVARTSLLTLQDRQAVRTREGREMSPLEWLAEVTFRPEQADTYPTFKIDNPELLSLIGRTEENLKIDYDSNAKRILAVFGFLPSRYRRFTYVEISPYLAELERQAQLAEAVDAPIRTSFQRSVLSLYANLITYQQLKYSFVPPEATDFLGFLRDFQAALPKGIEAIRGKQAGRAHDEVIAQKMVDTVHIFETMERFGSLLAVPPVEGAGALEWHKVGQALLETFQKGEVNLTVLSYATMAQAWRNGKPEQFNQAVQHYHDFLVGPLTPQIKKTNAEVRFNQMEPFYKSMVLYAFVFLVGIGSWLRWESVLGRSAFLMLLAAFLATTAGILTRMWLEGRPPVTNLYSSALFVGWAAVGLCLILEAVYKNAVGTVAGGAIGFCTLLIAHHLSFGGDTLEMMRAVLDSNFWLGTHVVVITMGYASTFLAGILAIIYVVLGVFTKWLSGSFDRRATNVGAVVSSPNASPRATASSPETNGQAISRMVYGIVCFATLFSLIGTILGGIWADQSWGRFWGWDPKENGALIIVIWNALILHARWGGLVKSRGLMCLAIFGNIVTSWSWFGTNMLGIGLHSYGFMDQAFVWLAIFMSSQIALVLLGSLTPLQRWRSFKARTPVPPKAVVAQV